MRPLLKRGFDVGSAGLLLLAASPAFLLIALLIWAEDRGPIFFAHRRIGRGGRYFGCLKFRSMRPDGDRILAELLRTDPAARAEWEATQKLRNDPRVTRIGRILRATSLDELPQLINVLRGEMSLVGPRPVVQKELDGHYGPAAHAYKQVRPGITGLWQVSGRSDTTYATRVALDVAYVDNPSLRKDLHILARTAVVVVQRKGAV
ncbi:sugar transferase [Roseomonas sp. NAR14]|uniref:Sugar transferase n=1 Tax=Roseomonas acroporae TaxID=2937791 RepID=A0A9X1Y9R7_9PROT|nr:sugar transferase [Roseomonas acroporae]MCK8784727.1 sugar transferase [Roseomonas acroporae]